jgi:hypothetical protein
MWLFEDYFIIRRNLGPNNRSTLYFPLQYRYSPGTKRESAIFPSQSYPLNRFGQKPDFLFANSQQINHAKVSARAALQPILVGFSFYRATHNVRKRAFLNQGLAAM